MRLWWSPNRDSCPIPLPFMWNFVQELIQLVTWGLARPGTRSSCSFFFLCVYYIVFSVGAKKFLILLILILFLFPTSDNVRQTYDITLIDQQRHHYIESYWAIDSHETFHTICLCIFVLGTCTRRSLIVAPSVGLWEWNCNGFRHLSEVYVLLCDHVGTVNRCNTQR